MKELVMVGSGGCMRELVWQIQEQKKEKEIWKIVGYVDRKKPLDVRVGNLCEIGMGTNVRQGIRIGEILI